MYLLNPSTEKMNAYIFDERVHFTEIFAELVGYIYIYIYTYLAGKYCTKLLKCSLLICNGTIIIKFVLVVLLLIMWLSSAPLLLFGCLVTPYVENQRRVPLPFASPYQANFCMHHTII